MTKPDEKLIKKKDKNIFVFFHIKNLQFLIFVFFLNKNQKSIGFIMHTGYILQVFTQNFSQFGSPSLEISWGPFFFKLSTSKWYISGVFRPNVSKFVLCTIEKIYFDALKSGLKNNQMCAHSNPWKIWWFTCMYLLNEGICNV